MEKVIGTVCEVSTTKAGSLLDEKDPCFKMSNEFQIFKMKVVW